MLLEFRDVTCFLDDYVYVCRFRIMSVMNDVFQKCVIRLSGCIVVTIRHRLEHEMTCLNPCILCARTCVNRDVHMKCNLLN